MNEETYNDAQLLAMGILNRINAVGEQNGDRNAMLYFVYDALMMCDELKRKIETLKIKLNDERKQQ